ncbi:MAG: PEP/pyruvate-binding domain-containing protein [Gammaproteobacteria bacterium]|nr:PEP/pyruvate-binding domain-containing protein [Gammaproteobacteria bacterium]
MMSEAMTAADRAHVPDSPAVCWFEECDRDSVAVVGGKCASLGELTRAGIRVPPGFAITVHGYHRFMRESGLEARISSALAGVDYEDLPGLEAVSVELRAAIEAAPLSIALEDSIAEHYRRLSVRCGVPAVPVAVRSSATAEDLPDASFAGQQDTYLWIRGVDELLARVRLCIASLFNARAIAYRRKMGYDESGVALSVGVQKMANSWAAGVMFTLDAINGDRSVITIDSNFGFGESVVSGEVTPDHFVVNKVSLEILERTVSRKERFYTVNPQTQTSQAYEMPYERQTVQSLVDEEIVDLAAMGKRIERHYGHPVDIEWAVDKDLPAGGNIFILQARPETVWSNRQPPSQAGGGTSAMDYIVASMLAGKKLS